MRPSHLRYELAMLILLASTAPTWAGAIPTGGFGGVSAPQAPGQTGGGGALMGFGGCFGGCPNPCSFGGCIGAPCNFNGCIGGIPCSFGGCLGGIHCSIGGCFGSFPCSFGGCMGFGGFPQTSQTYSNWSHSPGRSYYYRVLRVQTPAPQETALEFVMVHQTDRPKYFYFFDPVDKKYFGRFLIGAKGEQCFSLLQLGDRKTNLKDIPDTSFRMTGAMPTIPQIIRPRPGTTVEPALQNMKLMKPPESIPDALLGLPPEESK